MKTNNVMQCPICGHSEFSDNLAMKCLYCNIQMTFIPGNPIKKEEI